MALELRVQRLGGELGLVGGLRRAGEVDDGVRIRCVAQLLEALAQDVVVVGEGGGSRIPSKGSEPGLLDLDGLARARLLNVVGQLSDGHLADDLGDAVDAAGVLVGDCAAQVGGLAVAAVRVADVGRVDVGLGDEEVAVCRAGGEEILDGLDDLGLGLKLGGVGLREPKGKKGMLAMFNDEDRRKGSVVRDVLGGREHDEGRRVGEGLHRGAQGHEACCS